MLVYLRFFFKTFLWVPYEKTYLLDNVQLPSVFIKNNLRYFKPVTAYIINIKSSLIVYSVYYLTSLAKFKKIARFSVTLSFAPQGANLSRKNFLYFRVVK